SEQARDIQNNPVTAATSATTEAPIEEHTRATTAKPVETVPAETNEPAAEKLMMPNLVNRFFNASLKSRYSILVFETEEEYSDEFAEGIIMEQDIPENTTVTEGTVVHLKISKGAAYTLLPDYIGMKLSDYTNKLTELGVRFETVSEETSEVKKGYVVRCSKEIGDKVYISENEIVTVYYAVKPAKTTTTAEETEIPIDAPLDDENEYEEPVW
ncbi:MAG: PASTA domain-containing protein, partial [Oscillospiraceae bacterium]|nr:PASTA domain-containing protein [Oscillospiraceae bacterium]